MLQSHKKIIFLNLPKMKRSTVLSGSEIPIVHRYYLGEKTLMHSQVTSGSNEPTVSLNNFNNH